MRSRFWFFVGLAAIYVIFFLVTFFRLDPDLGWHLRAGQYYLDSGIPATDVFSHTAADFPWINHEWLHSTLVSVLYDGGSYFLLAAFFSGLWLGAVVIATRNRWLAVPTALMVSALLPYAGVRPIVWSVLLLAILQWLLDRKIYRILPLVLFIWANLHGSFVLGLMLLFIEVVKIRNKFLGIVLVISAALTLINPYGWRVYEEIARTTFDSQLRFVILEWLPFFFSLSAFLYLCIALSTYATVRPKWRDMLSVRALFLSMALSSTRHLPLFVVGNQRYLSQEYELLTDVLKRTQKTRTNSKKLVFNTFLVVAILSFFYGLWLQLPHSLARSGDTSPQSVNYIINKGCGGQIFNEYSLGGYLIYHLPAYKVFIDGRMPSWRDSNGNSYIQTYLEAYTDHNKRQDVFERYNIGCVVVSPDTPKPATDPIIYTYQRLLMPVSTNLTNKLIADLEQEGWQIKVNNFNETLLVAP